MHSPEAWGTSSQPLTDLEWANLKAKVFRQLSYTPFVGVETLRLMHFPRQAPFISGVLAELEEERVIKFQHGGWRVA